MKKLLIVHIFILGLSFNSLVYSSSKQGPIDLSDKQTAPKPNKMAERAAQIVIGCQQQGQLNFWDIVDTHYCNFQGRRKLRAQADAKALLMFMHHHASLSPKERMNAAADFLKKRFSKKY